MTKEDQLLECAVKLSITAHKHQKYGEAPYFHHILDVVRLTQVYCPQFICKEEAKICAYLHDAVEDSSLTIEKLKNHYHFPNHIIDAIYLLTDENGKNRKERKLKTYQKIKDSNNLLGIFVKMCDRLANVSHSLNNNNSSKLKMYKQEQQEFKKSLYRSELDFLWKIIDAKLDNQ